MTRLRARALVATALLLLLSEARAADVVIVQASHLRVYDEAVQAFQDAFPSVPHGGPKQAGGHAYSQYVLADADAAASLERRLRARRPDLVLAVGAQALQTAVGAGVPVVYSLVANPGAVAAGRRHVTGVPLSVPAGASLDALLRVAPRVKRVGVVHDPRRTATLVADALQAAARRGVTLVVREAGAPGDVPALLKSLEGNVDALWMLPDLTVSAPEAVEATFYFSLRSQVPVLTFAEKYLALGAAVAVVADPVAIGQKSAELAARVLAGEPPSRVPPAAADRVRVSFNFNVLRHLGLSAGEAP